MQNLLGLRVSDVKCIQVIWNCHVAAAAGFNEYLIQTVELQISLLWDFTKQEQCCAAKNNKPPSLQT